MLLISFAIYKTAWLAADSANEAFCSLLHTAAAGAGGATGSPQVVLLIESKLLIAGTQPCIAEALLPQPPVSATRKW